MVVLIVSLPVSACKDPKPVPPMPYQQNIMPNARGFLVNSGDPFYLQGGWYWYDNGMDSFMNSVYATTEEGKPYIWLDGSKTVEDIVTNNKEAGVTDDKQQVREVCADGQTTGFLALGFEVCSTKSDEEPYEFPAVLGACALTNRPYGVNRFRGIRFDLQILKGGFSRIEVQFKERRTDEDQPCCTVYKSDDSKSTCSAVEYLNDNSKNIHITAEALTAQSSDGELLNLSMLQAIHILVYGDESGEPSTLKYCLSNLYAFGFDNNADDEVGKVETLKYTCQDTNDRIVLEDTDTDWKTLEIDWERVDTSEVELDPKSFEIMTTEVTVGQYYQCIQNGNCTDVNEWETCNVYLYKEKIGDTEFEKKAANCVNWCQADDFCNWIGGRLPSESEWEAAAMVGSDGSVYPNGVIPDCTEVIMNDATLGVGCGDRMPAEVCSKVKDTDSEALCDMAGNLWEWVDDDAPPYLLESGQNWAEGYQKLKGGSLNSFGTFALQWSESTIEHPVTPHSPTRLGFRCVRDKNTDTDIDTDI